MSIFHHFIAIIENNSSNLEKSKESDTDNVFVISAENSLSTKDTNFKNRTKTTILYKVLKNENIKFTINKNDRETSFVIKNIDIKNAILLGNFFNQMYIIYIDKSCNARLINLLNHKIENKIKIKNCNLDYLYKNFEKIILPF